MLTVVTIIATCLEQIRPHHSIIRRVVPSGKPALVDRTPTREMEAKRREPVAARASLMEPKPTWHG